MATVGNDIHPSLTVPGFTQVFDGFGASRGVHPVVITIDKSDWNIEFVDAIYERETGMCAWSKYMCWTKSTGQRLSRTCRP
jgi:hypothetical protein